MELRDRLLYSLYGVFDRRRAVDVLAGPRWPDRLHRPAHQEHMPPGAKLIAVGVFSPFFVPLRC